jgi:BirA family biotin operon repressor/biotin-[acetyl-CoA-carboxylase] ligase
MEIIRFPQLESTNSFAESLLSGKRPGDKSVVITDYQTKGKGADSNSWESEKGKNLTFSIILYPDFAADQQFYLNKAISLGIYDFLQKEIPECKVTIKWPNDIYLFDNKVCGILIQNSLMGSNFDYSVVGIGLNVNQTLFVSGAPNPVSMKMLTGADYNLDVVLEKLLQSIFLRYAQVKTAQRKIESDYQKVLYRVMEWRDFEVKKTLVHARITGTNEYGQMLLETVTGAVLVCDLKEVRFVL